MPTVALNYFESRTWVNQERTRNPGTPPACKLPIMPRSNGNEVAAPTFHYRSSCRLSLYSGSSPASLNQASLLLVHM
jgi:hypothetical protein